VNLYGRVLAIIGVVVTGAAALCLLAFAAGGVSFAVTVSDTLQGLSGSLLGRAFLAFLGVAIMFAVAYVVMRALGVGASKVLAFDSSSGHMQVDISALEDCLMRTALEVDDVIDARARIRIQAGGLAKPVLCNVQVGLKERADVPGKGSEIGAKVKERFLEIIPIDTPPIVNLNVRIRAPKKPSRPPDVEEVGGVEGSGESAGTDDKKELEDSHDFTGERSYGSEDEKE
jgi:hypothetical protein